MEIGVSLKLVLALPACAELPATESATAPPAAIAAALAAILIRNRFRPLCGAGSTAGLAA